MAKVYQVFFDIKNKLTSKWFISLQTKQNSVISCWFIFDIKKNLVHF